MVLAAAIGAAGTIAGSLLANSGGTSAYESAKMAWAQNKIQKNYDTWYLNNISKQQLLKGPIWTRKGYEDAGFNPILTYMNGVGQFSNAGQVGMPVAQKDNKAAALVDAIKSGVSNYLDAQQTASNIELQEAQAENLGADTQNKLFDLSLKDLAKQEKQLDLIIKNKDVSNYDQRWALEQKERLAKIRKDIMDANSNQLSANAQQLSSQASQQNANYGSWSRIAGFIGHSSALRNNGSPQAIRRLKQMIGL